MSHIDSTKQIQGTKEKEPTLPWQHTHWPHTTWNSNNEKKRERLLTLANIRRDKNRRNYLEVGASRDIRLTLLTDLWSSPGFVEDRLQGEWVWGSPIPAALWRSGKVNPLTLNDSYKVFRHRWPLNIAFYIFIQQI